MQHKRKLLLAVTFAGAAAAFVAAQTDVAIKSIQYDLRMIGESIYEARTRDGKWPVRLADLEGTAYLKLPYRRGLLESGHYVIVWQQDLDVRPAANGDRILAYDDGTLLSRLGMVWACRGDLRVERINAAQVAAVDPAR